MNTYIIFLILNVEIIITKNLYNKLKKILFRNFKLIKNSAGSLENFRPEENPFFLTSYYEFYVCMCVCVLIEDPLKKPYLQR